MKALVITILISVSTAVLGPVASNAKDASYYLNHPDPKVRQEFMDRIQDIEQQKRIDEYERYGTNDPKAVARMNQMLWDKQMEEQAEIKRLNAELAQDKLERPMYYFFWDKIMVWIVQAFSYLVFLSPLYFIYRSWKKKNRAQQNAAHADKIARRKFEKEKILAGESLKTE